MYVFLPFKCIKNVLRSSDRLYLLTFNVSQFIFMFTYKSKCKWYLIQKSKFFYSELIRIHISFGLLIVSKDIID